MEPTSHIDTTVHASAFADPARRHEAWLLHSQAWGLVAQNRVAEALGLATEFARRHPDDPRALATLGGLQHHVGLDDQAAQTMLRAAMGLLACWDELRDFDASLVAVAGWGTFQLEQQLGLKLMQRAVELDAGCAMAHNNLGLALSLLGLFEDSLPHLRKAHEHSPTDPDYQMNLGAVLLGHGLQGESIQVLEQLRRSHGLDPSSRYNLALAYMDSGQPMDAVDLFAGYLQKNPDDGIAHGLAGLAYARMGWTAEGRREQAEAVRTANGDPEVQRLVDEIEKILGGDGPSGDELLLWFYLAAMASTSAVRRR